MKTQIIQLERHDDVTTVADKITWSKADRVLLVWPLRGEILTRPLDLVLVQRACQGMGVPLACVADDPDVLDHAMELGIPVFRSTKVAQRLPWRRRRWKKPFEPKSFQLRAVLEELRRDSLPTGFGWTQAPKLRAACFVLGIMSLLGLMLFLTPEAKIVLALERKEQAIDLPVWASPDLTSVNLTGGIPARVVTVVVEGQASQATTGSFSMPEKAATGRVQLTNLTDQAVTVPEGTVIQTQRDPVVSFHTTQRVSLLPLLGSTVEVAIEALQVGSQGNVAVQRIRAVIGNLGVKVSATNLEAITNGGDTINRTATPDDWDQLRVKLMETLKSSAFRELTGRLEPGNLLITQTLAMNKIIEEKQDPQKGYPADQANLTLRVEYKAWTYRTENLEILGKTALEANRPTGQMGILGSYRNSDLNEPVVVEGQARWKIHATQEIRQAWINRPVVQAVTGKSPEAARLNLGHLFQLVRPADIQVNPDWWPLLPLLPARIQVEIQ